MYDDGTDSSAEIWDQAAASYERSRQTDPVYLSCLRLTARTVRPDSRFCLDAGCGTGMSTSLVSSLCKLVVAVDYSYESLKTLKLKSIQNVVPVQADLKALPFKESVFDASVCANTLQHLRPGAPQKSVIMELRRVTKQNGILSVSVHHYSRSKRNAGWIKEGKPGQPGIDYIFRFSRKDLLAILPQASIRAAGYYLFLRIPFFGSRFQNLFASLFGSIAALLGYGHMLVAIQLNNKLQDKGSGDPR